MAVMPKKTKERAIGEIFTISKREFETLENKRNLCFHGESNDTYCPFMWEPCGSYSKQGACLPGNRIDGSRVVFREIKPKSRKVGA